MFFEPDPSVHLAASDGIVAVLVLPALLAATFIVRGAPPDGLSLK